MRLHRQAWLLVFCAALCACGGGGGGAAPGPAIVATTPTPTPPASSSASVQAGTAPASGALGTISAGYGGAVAFPATSSGSATANLLLAATNAVTLQASSRLPAAIGGNLDPLVYITLQTTATVTFQSWPSFAFFLPAGFALPAGAALYLGYDPGDVAGNWSTLAGPASINGSVATLAPGTGPITFVAGTTYAFALFATAQVLVAATPTPSPSPLALASSSPTPAATAAANAAFTCPATGAASFSRASAGGDGVDAGGRMIRRSGTARSTGATTMLAVTYARSRATTDAAQIVSRERALNATFVHSYDYPSQNITIRVVAVATSSLAATQATLRSQPGVQSVGVTGTRRYPTRVNTPFYTSDPYFQGFGANREVLPYAEAAGSPGQWDMHAIGLEHAFGYSQSGNGSGITNLGALGSSNISIAIIDTGEDAGNPELSGQIAYQHCYITSDDGSTQSSGNFSTDEDGHGTDVSGIAAAASNNALAFTGAGGNTQIYAYRVFPTPDDSCVSGNGGDDQCGASTNDIASAIGDAVAHNVNIISMSLGGGGCTAGVDDDPVEGAAVANALAHNVIVVSAAGNNGTQGVTAPGCDTGVIAVGATALDDGLRTGTTNFTSSLTGSASSTNPVEYVTSYTQFGSPGAQAHNANAWGIVAPGGDAASDSDADDLHWIENIWTTTPFDKNFDGTCTTDAGGASGDCRTLIDGTSMATPHVAGGAALILAVAPQFGTPGKMKQLLCSTADDLSDSHQGCGRLNVYRAMAVAVGDANPP